MNNKIAWLLLAIVSVYLMNDVLTDILAAEEFREWAPELSVFLLIIGVMSFSILHVGKLNKENVRQEKSLDSLKGKLADKIQDQFQKWSLSKAESEVAWLIIKGFSFNEISQMRGVNEKTIRKQSSSIYKKSATGNRSEFTASFLDDLLNQEENV